MRRLLLLTYILTCCNITFGQNLVTCSDGEFRQQIWQIVSEGNHQYECSYRHGINQMADKLEYALHMRSAAGLLNQEDSLEFTADLLKLRADWHYENGNYDTLSYRQAESLFRQAISIYTDNSFLSGPLNRLPVIQREMAQLMYKLGRYKEALDYTSKALEAYIVAFDNGDFVKGDDEYVTMLDLKSQQAMCLARMGNTYKALKTIDTLMYEYPKNSEGYYELLRKQGKIILLSGQKEAEKKALSIYKKYMAWRKADALRTLGIMTSKEREDYWMRIRPFVADCFQLEGIDAAFLYDVVLFSKGLLLQLNRMSGYGKASTIALASLKYTWQQVQGKLKEDDCAIEFLQYEKNGMKLMAALVMHNSGKPQWVAMMAPEDFMNYEVGPWKNSERIYTTNGARKNQLYNDSTLRNKLWNDQLQETIGKMRRIYFAPDGYLHQVAIEYMLPDKMSDVDAFRLTSTRRLMEPQGGRADAALIVGGVRYDVSDEESNSNIGTEHWKNDTIAYAYMKQIRANFEYLPGSLTESDSVRHFRACPKDTLLTGSAATELAFRTLCSQYPIINISTHGYFGASEIPQSTDVKTSMSDESLSQCVVAMAGANTNISTQDFDARYVDGILSAAELAESDLSNVDLAIISACQTGLGYVTSDGVFGIQRGLKNAGVKSLIVSLWNVNDRSTSLLMSRFHRNLRNGMPTHQAFMEARRSLTGTDVEKKGGSSKIFNVGTLTEQTLYDDESFDEPQFMDAFIVIDAIN